jgi:hypothetical protein
MYSENSRSLSSSFAALCSFSRNALVRSRPSRTNVSWSGCLLLPVSERGDGSRRGDNGAGIPEASLGICKICEMGLICRFEGGIIRDIGDLDCCRGGVGNAFGGIPLDVLGINRGEGRLPPGEKGGVWIELSAEICGRPESGLGVVREDPGVECMCESFEVALGNWSSRVALSELLGVLGVDFVIVLLRLRTLPTAGSVKSAGVTLPTASTHRLALGLVAFPSSVWRSRALLLSLLRSLIPLDDESRLPLARKNVFATSE